jgi:hypothetical protein
MVLDTGPRGKSPETNRIISRKNLRAIRLTIASARDFFLSLVRFISHLARTNLATMAISDSNTIAAPTEEVAETTTVETTKETTLMTEDKSNKEEGEEASDDEEEVAATTTTPKESHDAEPASFMTATKEDEVTTEELADKGPKEKDSIIKDADKDEEELGMVVEGSTEGPTKKEDDVVVETKDVGMAAIFAIAADEAATIMDGAKEDAMVIAADQPTVTTMTNIEGEDQTEASSIEQIDHPPVATTKKRPSPTKECAADGEAPANKKKQG